MGRILTERERAVLSFMVDHGVAVADKVPVREIARARWRESLLTVTAGASCGCVQCPSIDLVDGRGPGIRAGRKRVVLSAEHPKASLLLFIDYDRLSSLELAPHGDDVIAEFPPVSELSV